MANIVQGYSFISDFKGNPAADQFKVRLDRDWRTGIIKDFFPVSSDAATERVLGITDNACRVLYRDYEELRVFRSESERLKLAEMPTFNMNMRQAAEKYLRSLSALAESCREATLVLLKPVLTKAGITTMSGNEQQLFDFVLAQLNTSAFNSFKEFWGRFIFLNCSRDADQYAGDISDRPLALVEVPLWHCLERSAVPDLLAGFHMLGHYFKMLQARDYDIAETAGSADLTIANSATERQIGADTPAANEGIEDDGSGDDPGERSEPFNPNSIEIFTKPIPMDVIMRRTLQGTLIYEPDFQRHEVWDETRKSQLIESLMLNIPIPMFYVSADADGVWTVVDGLQRMSAFREFVLGKEYLERLKQKDPEAEKYRGRGFALSGLEFWDDLNGKQMADLPPFIANRINEAQFFFTIINPRTDEEVRLNIFKRINTGGIPLSAQEIRNALYQGPATALLAELAAGEAFKSATCGTVKRQRMADQELVLRLLSFMVRDFHVYTRGMTSERWLAETVMILNKLGGSPTRQYEKQVREGKIKEDSIIQLDYAQIRQRFELGMERSKIIFGEHAFRRSREGQPRSAINKALFECWGVLLGTLKESQFRTVLEQRDKMLELYYEGLTAPNGMFSEAVSRRSGRFTAVAERFNSLRFVLDRTIYGSEWGI